jgi:hypothetical protein
MLEEVQEDFKSLQMALRSRDLKEKGLNNIFFNFFYFFRCWRRCRRTSRA